MSGLVKGPVTPFNTNTVSGGTTYSASIGFGFTNFTPSGSSGLNAETLASPPPRGVELKWVNTITGGVSTPQLRAFYRGIANAANGIDVAFTSSLVSGAAFNTTYLLAARLDYGVSAATGLFDPATTTTRLQVFLNPTTADEAANAPLLNIDTNALSGPNATDIINANIFSTLGRRHDRGESRVRRRAGVRHDMGRLVRAGVGEPRGA